MKFSINFPNSGPSGAAMLTATILSLILATGVTAADRSPAKATKPTPSASKPPKTTPTPTSKLDPKTEAELLQAEDRFINAIRNADRKELGELLHDKYADSFGQHAGSAIVKRGVLDRLGTPAVPAYRVVKDRKLTVSVDLYTVEGLAKAERQGTGDDQPKDEWFKVRRLWTKTDGRWVITAQMIVPVEESGEKEEKDKEKK
jgi:hypothetical protein